MTQADNPGPHPGEVAVLIPAYRPDHALVDLAAELASAGFRHIVIVDDGSGAQYASVFDAAARIDGVRIVGHATALGRGAALKTGINHALYSFPELAGIVTADGAAQYSAADIVRVAQTQLEHRHALVLGAGACDEKASFRERFGAEATRRAVWILAGSKLTDARTGLRAMSAGFAASLLKLTAAGDEFELDMLILARQDGFAVIEEPVTASRTRHRGVSHGVSSASSLRDSLRMYLVLLRFSSVSLLTALIDNLVFYFAYRRTGHLLAAQATARTASSIFNYLVVRNAVFNAKGAHKTALPKYLTLLVLNASISYTCIRIITALTHLPVLGTKVTVESLLFFASFTLQREWVFLRPPVGGRPPASRVSGRTGGAWIWLLLLVPLVVEVFGFRSAHLLTQRTWNGDGVHRFSNYVEAFLGVAIVFGLLARRYFRSAVLAGLVLCSVYAVGFAAVGAVVLFVFSCTVLGRILFGGDTEGPLAFHAGLGVWIALMYIVMFKPVHYPATYLIALALPVVAGYRHSTFLAVEWLSQVRPSGTRENPEPSLLAFAAFAVLAFVLVAMWLIVLKPEVSTDGLATHLVIPIDIASHHFYTIDFHEFIWALMPVGTDLTYTVVYSLGGEYAARLLNFAVLAGLALLLFRAACSFVSKPLAALLTALFLSTPIVYLTTGSLFSENLIAFTLTGAVVSLWRFHETRSTRYLMLTAMLTGTSISLKFGAFATGLIILAFLFWDLRTEAAAHKRSQSSGIVLRTLGAAALALMLSSIPYARAWRNTGNPFFPFQTGPFKSSLVANDIRDERFNQHLTWRTPITLTFHTDRYYEGQAGSFGFQYLLFLPLIAAAFFAAPSFRSRSAITIGLVSAVIVVAAQPNARYLYSSLPLLTLGIASGLVWLRARKRRIFETAIALAIVACVCNIWFLPSADWYHRDFYSWPLFTEAGRQTYLHRDAPVREVIAYVNRVDPNAPVVMTDDSTIAGIVAPVYAVSWHDYSFLHKIMASPLPEDVYRLFTGMGVAQLIVDRDHKDRQESLAVLLSVCGQPEFSSGSIAAMKLRPDCEAALIARAEEPLQCQPNDPVTKGIIDDVDPRLTLKGRWTRETKFPETFGKTIVYSNVPGARACLSIEGTGLRYVYTKAFNRGTAEIKVDGVRKAAIDLYSKGTLWQAQTEITGLAPGRHEVSIDVLPLKNAAATDFYVDVDSVEVF